MDHDTAIAIYIMEFRPIYALSWGNQLSSKKD